VPRYDAVVVGAGPAGSATATQLARGGARVLLCDRSAFPRDKACGGGLTPRGVAALERLKVDLAPSDVLAVAGLEMIGAGRSLGVPFPQTSRWPSYGLVARRSVLDQRILDAAVDAGAEFRQTRVLGPLFVDGLCRGVRIASNGTTEDVEADWTVAADGATSTLARAAGLAPATTMSPEGFWYAALRAYAAPVVPRTMDGVPVLEFYPLRTAAGGWLPAYGWVFPLPDGSANIGVDLPHAPALAACPPLREAFDAFVERLRRERPGFAEARLEAPPQGALLPESMRGFRPGAPGLLSVGDAAGMITPYSGEGIAYALEAAELAAEAVAGERRPSEALHRYAAELRAGYGFQFATSFRIMKAMRRPVLAAAAAAVGFRSKRALRAGVRVMAYLIDDAPVGGSRFAPSGGRSTVSRAYRRVERLWPRAR
jgi:geranylgeranyl reductase family protein